MFMEQMQGMQQNGETRPGHGGGLDEQLAEWSAELFRDPQYRNTYADAEHTWRLESAARTRLIIKKQLRDEIEQEMAKELGLPANWRGNKLKSLAEWHEKMACLAKAYAAPRCEHVFQDGTRCGSPRMKNGEFCYAHERMAQVRPKKLNLLAMEDANAIMLNIMEINRALVDEEITEKRAGMLLYSQQLGLQALGKLTFQKTRPEEMVRLEEIAADQRRKAQIGEEEISRERTRMDTNGEERFATDERGQALIEEEELTLTPAHEARAGDPGAEWAENAEDGMNELSPLDDGMNRTGEEDRKIGKAKSENPYRGFARMIADKSHSPGIGDRTAEGPIPLGSHGLKELEERSHRRDTAWAG
jgi:hypothetical protein